MRTSDFLKYALGTRSKAAPPCSKHYKRRETWTAPNNNLPNLNQNSLDLEAGDTIFSSSKSRTRKSQACQRDDRVKLPRLMNTKSVNEDDTLITID